MKMQKGLPVRRLLLAAILAICTSNVASLNIKRRHAEFGESSLQSHISHAFIDDSLKSPAIKDNEIFAETEKKVSHRLIGGHLRTSTSQEIDETGWDDGILLSSAGNGKETKNNRRDEDDEKKTLSQQVKEGKYGLIQDEVYKQQPKRPGIISYAGNPEVPKDTEDNLGGLDEDEIWLAENHVLVLKGGKFPDHEDAQASGDGAQAWPPIDNYEAPNRQVKIPSKPKVPPPFPVQLSENGPIQIIRTNGTKEIFNSTVDYKKDSLFTKGLISEDSPLFAVIANGTILTPDTNSTTDSSEDSKDEKDKNDELPPGSFPPFYHAIPPGAVFVPPPSNQTDYDEEDQSIYYPPPYSFEYKQDNTTAVPPGPLVPGIILPPPPDFFSALEENQTTTKKFSRRPGTTSQSRPRPTYLPPRKLTTKQQKATTILVPTGKYRSSSNLSSNTKVNNRTYKKNLTESTTRLIPKTGTFPYVKITTSVPEESTVPNIREVYTISPLVENQVTSQENVREKNQAWSRLVSNKTMPIVAYYATSTQSTLKKPVEVTPATIKSIITTSSPGRAPSQASYYFYEESNEQPTETTLNPSPFYYKTTTPTPFYETVTPHAENKKQYYNARTVPSKETTKDLRIKYIGPVKNSEPVRYSAVTQSSVKYERAQGQRLLPDRTPLYYQTISASPAVPSYYTTAKPQAYYRQEAKSKPIYQYSYEAADYSKLGNQRQQYEHQQRTDVYSEYRNLEIVNDNYNGRPYGYDSNEYGPQKEIRPEVYKPQQQIYPSTTPNSIASTTANPQQVYYTQQDERYLDDVTKEYFTIFGKKLPHKGIPNTTPIYSKSQNSVTIRPSYNPYAEESYSTPASVYKTPNVKVRYGDQSQRPYSLKDDILVNFRQPLPAINPDSEFITVINHNEQQVPNYRIPNREIEPLAPLRAYPHQPVTGTRSGPSTKYIPTVESAEELDEDYPQLPISLADDIKVNYRDPRPALNPDAEFIGPISVQGNKPESPKAYFAYSLPGDGGHFYFLTPQAVTQRPERNVDHIYPNSRGTELLRRRRRPRRNV